jgi:rhamnose transport system permease protein
MATLGKKYKREISAAAALGVLLVVVAIVAPSFFAPGNLRDLVINNVPTLLIAIGMTLVILVGQIDISVGSQFVVCSVAAGFFGKDGHADAFGACFSNAYWRSDGRAKRNSHRSPGLPSIIVTLAMLVMWRDALRWITEGAWVQGLPNNFQWFGLGQGSGEIVVVLIAFILFAAFAWSLRNLVLGRNIYAVGSDTEAARLAGIIHPASCSGFS